MGLISVREVIKTVKIVFFGSQKIVLSSHDSHLAPEMGETHDELLEVDFAIAVIVKDVDDPPEIARYTVSTFHSKFLPFKQGGSGQHFFAWRYCGAMHSSCLESSYRKSVQLALFVIGDTRWSRS